MRTILRRLLWAVAVLVICAVGGFLWAKFTVASLLARTPDVHSVSFPIPVPLTEHELADLRAARAGSAEPGADPLAGVDLTALALERALSRGKHLVEARYGCVECHGKNFGGGVMIDDPAIGRILGPNITSGKGGVTAAYTTTDWDRIVRHGVKRDGHPAVMPSEDFLLMSDQELSDIIAYLRLVPAVDHEVAAVSLGPVGTILMATGKLPLSVDKISDHGHSHPATPPEATISPAFGAHLAGVCTGCHRQNLQGGPIAGGPPDWAPATNLTPHADGLSGWTYKDFEAAMREGVRPDGTKLRAPMTLILPYAQKMTPTELAALWAYISTVAPLPTGT